MAVEYSLKLDGAFRQPELEEALGSAGFTANGGAWSTDGATAVVDGTVDRFGRYSEAFGFSPSTDVLFSIDKSDGYEAGMDAMVRAVAAALGAVEDDAVLVANHDTALLLRRDGAVTLTDRDDWWSADKPVPMIAHIAQPYRFETLPIF